MQNVSFPIGFPAYAYKVQATTSSGPTWHYGALDQTFEPLMTDVHRLDDLAAHVVEQMLHLRELPATEEVPDTFCDLGDEEWAKLNRQIRSLVSKEAE